MVRQLFLAVQTKWSRFGNTKVAVRTKGYELDSKYPPYYVHLSTRESHVRLGLDF